VTWERRWHPLREEWVTITSHRNNRPWSGAALSAETGLQPDYHPDCYLCPGNQRISAKKNDPYTGVYVFDNDHPAFDLGAPEAPDVAPGFYRNAPATGKTSVVCYSPIHNLTLAELEASEIRSLVDCWADQTIELSRLPEINHVLIFENKGEIVGVSNPHPHCQIYATNFVFKNIELQIAATIRFREQYQESLFEAVISLERQDARRILSEQSSAISFIPYFARFPYETYIAPKRKVQFLHQLHESERDDLALCIQQTLTLFDNLWQLSFPYVLVLYQAPCDGESYEDFHFHIEIHPPLRQPGLQKFLAGAELGGGCFLNDASPEESAAELRQQATIHYKQL